MRFRRALALLLAFVGPAAPALAGWATAGPPGTRSNAVSAALSEASAYATAAILESSTSAIYRTDDGGQSWTALSEVPRGDSYAQVFADPRSAARVFAAVQRGNGTTDITRSDDLGENWSTVLTVSIRCVPSFAAGAQADAVAFTCGSRFFRTGDAGLTWQEPPTPFGANTRLASAPGVFYAYTLTQIFRSADGGTTWVPAGSAPAACPGLLSLVLDPSDPSVFLAGTGVLGTGGFQCGGVYRSANSGASWAAAGFSGAYVTDVAFDRHNPSNVYACASYVAGILPPGGVYASADGGRTFSNASLPTTGALVLAVSASGKTVYAATPGGVYARRGRQTRVVGPR